MRGRIPSRLISYLSFGGAHGQRPGRPGPHLKLSLVTALVASAIAATGLVAISGSAKIAAQGTGSTLLSETFEGTSVPDPNGRTQHPAASGPVQPRLLPQEGVKSGASSAGLPAAH